MRKALLNILLMSVLTACDFFYSEVPYKGNEEESMLVVNSTMDASRPYDARAYVGRSYFMTDSTQYLVEDTGDGRYYYGRKSGVLKDAFVTIQVGQNAPMELKYRALNKGSDNVDSLGCYVIPRSSFCEVKPGDTLRLNVAHSRYGSAEAIQVCPSIVEGKISNVSFNKYGEMSFALQLPAYKGSADDVLAIEVNLYDVNAKVYSTAKDTEELLYEFVNYYEPYVYSLDPIFSQLENSQTSAGYFGGHTIYIPASAMKFSRIVNCIMDMRIPDNGREENVVMERLTMDLKLTTLTKEGYEYKRSYQCAVSRETSLPELTSRSDASSLNLMDYIEDLFDELGGQEDYLLYGNIEGERKRVLGHFSLQQTSSVAFEYTRE